MTAEERELLLTDLCGRITKRPKGVLLNKTFDPESVTIIGYNGRFVVVLRKGDYDEVPAESVRLYLRPLSSMTEEERDEIEEISHGWFYVNEDGEIFPMGQFTDSAEFEDAILPALKWLNKNMFDYRGLIPMNLAVEAKEETYKAD